MILNGPKQKRRNNGTLNRFLLVKNLENILYSRASLPVDTCVPPNQNCTLLCTPK